jgi:amino acid transporter
MLFFGNLNYSLYFSIAFWIILTLLLEGGIERLKRIETLGVIIVAIIIFFIFISYLPSMNLENLRHYNTNNFFLPIGVVLFALLGFTSLPELRAELKGDEKDLKYSIILGSLIPIFIYLIFSISFIAVLGKDIREIATLSFGPLIALIGIFTMLTCYFVLSFSLKDVCIYDLNIKRGKRFFIKSIVPLLLFLIIYSLRWDSFSKIISITGVLGSGLTGILCIFMNYRSKKIGKRKPEYTIYINKFILSLISLIFLAGVLIELYSLFF